MGLRHRGELKRCILGDEKINQSNAHDLVLSLDFKYDIALDAWGSERVVRCLILLCISANALGIQSLVAGDGGAKDVS